jgi:phosphoribosylpyrophosphate synthetase
VRLATHRRSAGRGAGAIGAQRFPDVSYARRRRCVRDDVPVQATGPPVNQHLVELLLLVDAARPMPGEAKRSSFRVVADHHHRRR